MKISGPRSRLARRRESKGDAERRGVSARHAARRPGRPRKAEPGELATPERLLASAAEAFIDLGFDASTMEEIARRAGVTTAAIYNHFDSKGDLLFDSARWALGLALAKLRRHLDGDSTSIRPLRAVELYLSPAFARTRRLILEIHLASMRYRHLADMVAGWHRERLAIMLEQWPGATKPSVATVKAHYLLLLGACHVDSLSGLTVPTAELLAAYERAERALFAPFGPGLAPRRASPAPRHRRRTRPKGG